jgi:ribonuclease HI
MLVTINTDASYSSAYKIGAFSFWMVSNSGRLFGAGALKGKVSHSQEAEFKAVLNALHFLFEKSEWKGVKKVIINTDCKPVVDMINGGLTYKWAVNYKVHYNSLVKKYGITIEARKVKAHSGTDEKRKWVNDWCDQQAKKVLRQTIKTKQL